MKVNSILVLIIFCLSYSSVNTASSNEEIKSSGDLKKDYDEILHIKRRSKLVACLSLVRNSLAEGNAAVKEVIDNSNFDRSRSFDKIILIMVSYCEKKITDAEMEQALVPENILTPISSNLVKFDKNILKNLNSVSFSDEELAILKEMNESSQAIDTDLTLQEEEIGLMGLKLSQLGKSTYIFISIILAIVLLIIFGGLYLLTCKKKEVKDKKKKNK